MFFGFDRNTWSSGRRCRLELSFGTFSAEIRKQFAEREADCYADKVELIREEQAEEQSAERAEEHEERAERSLENDAWERIRKHQ